MIERLSAPLLEAPGRLFQLTRATRTHTQVWLQADASREAGFPLRLEVLFPSVQYLSMPFVLRDLSLRAATEPERSRLAAAHGLDIDAESTFYLLAKDRDWFIVSGIPLWAEADLSYFDDSVFWSHTGRDDVVTVIGTLE